MKIGQWIHFSIDDVIESLKWIYQNQPESIFEQPMFRKLKEWHEKYKISCDLYVFEMVDGFHLSDLQNKYWEELDREASWLRFGWHRRTSGKLLDSVDEEISSFRRTEKLLGAKLGTEALSRILRLHRWSAEPELLIQLKDFKIRHLFTADDGQKSYDCSLQEMEMIEQSGGCWARGFFYERTDIRLDYLDGQTSVKELVEAAVSVIEKFGSKNKVAVFVHEWKFMEVVEGIDSFWEMFWNTKKNIFPNAAAVVNGKIYFSASNDKNLYRLNVDEEGIERIIGLPLPKKMLSPFESLCVYKDNIWMIPWMAVYILVYDINTGLVKELHFPFDEKLPQSNKYRSHIVQDRFLWLLPTKYPEIIRIDMETYDFVIFDQWPAGTLFNENSKHYFNMMYYRNGILYLFNDGCNKSIILDTVSGQMTEWKTGKDKWFGVVEKDCLYVSPIHMNDRLQVISKDFLRTESVPDYLWIKEVDTYSYWFAQYAEGIVFFLPHDANGIIMKDVETNETVFMVPDLTDFRSLRKNQVFSVHDIQLFQDTFLCIPFRGNMFLLIDRNGHVTGRYIIQISLNMLCNYDGRERETEEYSVVDFIKNISRYMVCEIKKADEGVNVGEKMHQAVKTEKE